MVERGFLFAFCVSRVYFFLTAITVGVLLINNTRRDKVLSHGRGSLFGGVLWVLLGVLRGGGAVLRWSAAHCAAAALTARFVVLWGACCVVGWSAGQHDSSVHSDSVILRKEGRGCRAAAAAGTKDPSSQLPFPPSAAAHSPPRAAAAWCSTAARVRPPGGVAAARFRGSFSHFPVIPTAGRARL